VGIAWHYDFKEITNCKVSKTETEISYLHKVTHWIRFAIQNVHFFFSIYENHALHF